MQSFRRFHRLSVALLVAAALVVVVTAQTRQPFSRVAVVVTPDHANWTYQPGEAVAFRISHELYHGGWKVAFDTARPTLEADKESVKRNRLVNLAARSLVLLSHER